MKIVQCSRPLTPFSSYVQSYSTTLTLDVQFRTNPPPPNDNQSIKGKHNPRMTIICYQVDFCSQYQLINLVWLSTDFFLFSWSQPCLQSCFKKLKTSFSPSSYNEKICWGQGWAEAILSAFSWLYILVFAVN